MHDCIRREDWIDLLAYPSFSREDTERMNSLARLLEKHTDEAFALFLEEWRKDGEVRPSEEQAFRRYVSMFWSAERNLEYVSAIVDFFHLLLADRFSPGRLMAALSHTHLFWMRIVQSRLAFAPKKRSVLLEAMQRAADFDKQILMHVSLRHAIEAVSQGSAERAEKHAEPQCTRQMARMVELQQERAHHAAVIGEQLTSSIHEVARHAETVAHQTSETVSMAENGKQVITLAMEEILRSGGTFESIVHRFAELQRYVSNIEHVVELIRKISDQTHLLALNASIEAARTGEMGRGFSVVAQEIRKLARSAQDAVRDIERNVEDVLALTGDVADSIQTASKVIQTGMHRSNDAFRFVTDLISRIAEFSRIIRQITTATTDQSAAAETLSAQMRDMSEKLRNLSGILREAVEGSVEETRERASV
jgi:methyl-accepting chemotaxis protein